jgi:hypothetical protein
MTEKISKYHKRFYIGKGIEGADEYGYAYHWDTTHQGLESTSTFKTQAKEYCSYCQEVALPIQANLKDCGDYSVTGHTCACDAAEAEKEFRKKEKELKSKHCEEMEELKNQFINKLRIDPIKVLKIKQEDEMKLIKWKNEKKDSYFTSVNGNYIYR